MAMENTARGLLPSKRRNDYEVSGRDGTVSIGNATYNTRQVTIDICFIDRNPHNLQLFARDVAQWLSGTGILFFDDEPQRAYDATIYATIDAEELVVAKRASVIFECQPFAKSISPLQSLNHNIASGNQINIFSHGTHPTPGIFILRNTGTVAINNIVITRRSLIHE